jgi:hypothetical protein
VFIVYARDGLHHSQKMPKTQVARDTLQGIVHPCLFVVASAKRANGKGGELTGKDLAAFDHRIESLLVRTSSANSPAT